MANGTKTIEAAREEVRRVLRRYGVRWEDVAPDKDQEIWEKIAPSARRTRKKIFKEFYPSLNARAKKKKKN